MEKTYYYQIGFNVIVDNEEFNSFQKFSTNNPIYARGLALVCFKEISETYKNQLISTSPIVDTWVSLSFVEENEESEFSEGEKIYFKRANFHELYRFSKRKLEKTKGSFEFEESILKSDRFQNLEPQLKDPYDKTDEVEIVAIIEAEINKVDPDIEQSQSLNFSILKCSRCGKNMIIEQRVAMLYSDKSKASKKVSISCNTCINTYFGNPIFNFHLQEIFDKNGKSVIKGKRDLL